MQAHEDKAVLETLDSMHQLKAEGKLRFVCVSTHDFNYATRLIESGKLDIIMLRYNMAHKTAEKKALPATLKHSVHVFAFSTTRSNTLQQGHKSWSKPPPTTADCVSYALANNAIGHVINSISSSVELDGVLAGMWGRTKRGVASLSTDAASHQESFETWEAYGKIVYADQEGLVPSAESPVVFQPFTVTDGGRYCRWDRKAS